MNGPNGYFTPSNIVRSGDGYFYTMFRAQPRNLQQMGTCIMRTRDLSDPHVVARVERHQLQRPVREPVRGDREPGASTSVPRSTSTASARSARASPTTPTSGSGCWSATRSATPRTAGRPASTTRCPTTCSNWTNAQLLMAAEITFSRDCNLPDPIKESSLIDPNSTSRNFETVGQNAQQFYTWYHLSGCNGTLDRDLLRDPDPVLQPAAGRPVGPDDRGRPHAGSRRGRRIRRHGLRGRERHRSRSSSGTWTATAPSSGTRARTRPRPRCSRAPSRSRSRCG